MTDLPLLDIDDDAEAKAYQEAARGLLSACQARSTSNFFIEKSRKCAAELRRVVTAEYTQLDNRCEIRTGEANAEIKKWCAARD